MNIDIVSLIKDIIMSTKNLAPTFNKKHPNTKYSLHHIIKELIYLLKSGVSYRMLRSTINYKTLHYYHSKFVKYHVFEKLYHKIKTIYLRYIISDDKHCLFIDSTVVNNKYGVNKIGRNKFYKNKKATKISALTDINGFPLSVIFMKGNYHDNSVFEKHIRDALIVLPNKKLQIIADKAYASNKNYQLLESKKIDHIIPPRKNMKLYKTYSYDHSKYKQRIKIEHLFGKLKINRRLSFRYDKFLRHFKGFVLLAFSILSINILKNKYL